MMKKIILNSLMILLLLAAVFVLPIFYPAGMAVYFRLLLLLLLLAAGFQLFKTLCIDRQVSPIIANTATVLFSLFVIFILLEAVFMFIPRSHSADYTLASKLWYAKYWKPINSLGFRDQEPDNKHPVILFVGDSFTAGHGLKSVSERFSDIVGEELNKKQQKYTIVNIGRPNLDSRGEYETMMNFLYLTRIKPAKIILQYCGNDIEGAAARNGLIFDGFRPPDDMSKFTVFIGAGSYVFNYLYFLFPREYLGMSYINYLTDAYKNDKVMANHKEDLMLFVDYARKNSIPLVVVVFPFLADIKMSNAMYVNDIVSFFEANKLRVINVSKLVEKTPVEDRVVNKNDTHASAKLNKMIAREILNKLE
ncbi:MAG TPA: SGNH/GDSL hydrolase family protein [Smithella sp.]|nr:SGNH/GDSL hydrolase family protein [Smithella sp.]MDM7986855.1 SGNH/GDSL hydrolase family protein [Smithella sp.]HNY51163.1 SGNH/GDSL hydrolase family protein [Smithella sp.]HOG89729.1 SGNH/GDSL hydrolase family protein [Smithella sp.]HOU51453.1 SGNH/GDSL hydrolase family protein [Smithella sp.]